VSAVPVARRPSKPAIVANAIRRDASCGSTISSAQPVDVSTIAGSAIVTCSMPPCAVSVTAPRNAREPGWGEPEGKRMPASVTLAPPVASTVPSPMPRT
jgi:hypothetical protein